MNNNLLKIVEYGKYMGVFPFKISVYKKRVHMSYSKPFTFYSLLMFSILMWSVFWCTNNDLPNIMRIFHHMSNVFASASHILILSTKKDDLECFINKIQKVDELLGKTFRVESKWANIEICIFFITFTLMLLDFLLYHEQENIYHELNSLVSNLMLFYLDTAIILNYKSCVKVIRAEILNLRSSLVELMENDHPVYTINVTDNNNLKLRGDTIDFSRLKKVYRTIFESSQALNDCYNVPILISSLVCMVNVIIAPFLLYYKVTAVDEDMAIFSALGWLIGHILKILIIVEPCHSCQKQGKKLAQLMMRYSCYNSSFVQVNQLRKFYTVVEESPVQFHMGGIAKITRSLFPAILSGFTTYLVILFQMKNEIFGESK